MPPCSAKRRCRLAVLALLLMPTLASAFEPVWLDDLDWRPRARLQYDRLLDSDAPAQRQDPDDGAFRRARLGLRARYERDWVFTGSVDVVDKPRLRDFSLEYRGLPVRIEVGRFQEPFGLAEYGSSKHTLFMERPSPSALGPDYGLGAALNYRAPIWAVTVGAFAASDSPQFGGDRNERALTGRAHVTPSRGRHLVHLGLSYSDRSSRNPQGLRLGGSGETILLSGYAPRSPRDTAQTDYRLAAAEFAYRWRSLLVQAERFDARSDGAVDGDGWYAEAGYILTGERRRYSTRFGSFDGVSPRRPLGDGGWGAFEVGARYSETDFSSAGGDQGSVIGLALNWYPRDWLRVSLNAQQIELAAPGQASEQVDLVQARIQLAF